MDRVFANAEALCRLTGLNPVEFALALGRFEYALENVLSCETVAGRERLKAPGAGLKGGLASSRERLLFILTYYHLYPTQSAIASFFGLTQQWASLWIKFLTPLANEAFSEPLKHPPRMPLRLKEWIEREPYALLLTDAWKSSGASFMQTRKKTGPRPRTRPLIGS